MAVYTPLSLTEIAPWFEREFSLGKAIDLRASMGVSKILIFFLIQHKQGKLRNMS